MARHEGPVTELTTISGYEILERIGQGGMGAVFLARHMALDRQVAVKFMALDPAADPGEQLARFRREAELMARVAHPNIVSVIDFGITAGQPYLVMEYVEGGDLRRRMTPGRPMPVAQVRALLAPVSRALTFLHGLGILHCDLKPENILLHHEDHPKVSDFGIAVRHATCGATAGAAGRRGTVGYIAPEQQYQLKMDARADQYSLAALAYELLSGCTPLGVIKPPSSHNPALGAAVDAVLLRALAEDPEDRFATVGEFQEALERALDDSDRRPAPGRPVVGWLVAAVVVLLIADVALLALWLFAPRRAEPAGGTIAAPAPPAPPREAINSIGMTLVLIPPGEFVMGPHTVGADAHPDGRPGRRVRISQPFYMGAHEVTIGQFRAFVAATDFRTEAEADGLGGLVWDHLLGEIVSDPAYSWNHPGWAGAATDDQPVTQVSWNDAQAFCRWLGQEEGLDYGLPTEAEWEYACRAGASTRWCMGDDPEHLDRFAWFRENSLGMPHPVGGKRPNAFGLYDLHGNVWEWCADAAAPAAAPGTAERTTAPPPPTARVLRGGAWDCAAERVGADHRNAAAETFRFLVHGFRVCRRIPEVRVGRRESRVGSRQEEHHRNP